MKSIVVDDDLICRTIFQKQLLRYGQCDVAANGRDAIEAYKKAVAEGNPYQLMVLDILMPGISGKEVLENIRELEKQNGVMEIDKLRVIIITASDDWYNRGIVINKLDFMYENYFIKSNDFTEFKNKIADLGFVLD